MCVYIYVRYKEGVAGLTQSILERFRPCNNIEISIIPYIPSSSLRVQFDNGQIFGSVSIAAYKIEIQNLCISMKVPVECTSLEILLSCIGVFVSSIDFITVLKLIYTQTYTQSLRFPQYYA